MRTSRPAHLKHFDYTGFYRYSLTFCTDQRRAIFIREDIVRLVLLQISRAANDREFAVIAYCFMPDHLHLLVHGQSEAAECRGFIALAKQYSGYYYTKEYRRRLWQRYGYERTLRKDDDSLRVAKYILENPVRAGMVGTVLEYPFAGSLVCDARDLLASIQDGMC